MDDRADIDDRADDRADMESAPASECFNLSLILFHQYYKWINLPAFICVNQWLNCYTVFNDESQ
ncbi:MAG: hypothetical protein B1H11_03095 [Desulfobacteraceae bacterium 4484_190.1]|nr:MAG: hypothetical protein B1H11_03095 [Desulfobacteraceae bacterium 4484_190.1]